MFLHSRWERKCSTKSPPSMAVKKKGLKRWTQAYLACVAAVDDNVGKVMDTLNQTQLKDNTVVVLVSDHGFHMGQKRTTYTKILCGEKKHPYSPDHQGPGYDKVTNTSINKAVSLIDVYPPWWTCVVCLGKPKKRKGIPWTDTP